MMVVYLGDFLAQFALVFSSGKMSMKPSLLLILMGARKGRRNGQIGSVVRGNPKIPNNQF